MIISRSESRNSRTRFKLVFEENTSRSYRTKSAGSKGRVLGASPLLHFGVLVPGGISPRGLQTCPIHP